MSGLVGSDDLCAHCKSVVPRHVRDCTVCGEAVGFPNVRAAKEAGEVAALGLRHEKAFVSARAASYETELVEFGEEVSKSEAVIARSMSVLDRLVNMESSLLSTYHQEVRSNGRVPQDNSWDKGRDAADSTINPNYYQNLHFAALSLNGRGVDHYGSCHITLVETAIANRASVFEENPFIFSKKHSVVVGSQPPKGYRATWADRGKLAQAKLHHKLKKGMNPSEFVGILVDQGTGDGNEDFIEVHVYGALSGKSIGRVLALAPKGAERHVWRSVRKKLVTAGLEVEEI
ncbi:hypothetical protein [Mesorhizobium sp. L-8-3]|uniref:hypothetical protein n=1 Tax=Mesorhizobium sp. L-8-3 TaxID=2744522 RepID=UPI001928BFFC|nr:hypothetical protein [Mesorhizobium sp. L-8-3]